MKLKTTLFFIALLASSTLFAARIVTDHSVLLINNNTIEKGDHKTILYMICNNNDNYCSKPQNLDIQDASSEHNKVAVRIPLKMEQNIQVISAIEKDKNGKEIGRGDYLYEDNKSHSHCDAESQQAIVFDNYDAWPVDTKAMVFCQTVYR